MNLGFEILKKVLSKKLYKFIHVRIYTFISKKICISPIQKVTRFRIVRLHLQAKEIILQNLHILVFTQKRKVYADIHKSLKLTF